MIKVSIYENKEYFETRCFGRKGILVIGLPEGADEDNLWNDSIGDNRFVLNFSRKRWILSHVKGDIDLFLNNKQIFSKLLELPDIHDIKKNTVKIGNLTLKIENTQDKTEPSNINGKFLTYLSGGAIAGAVAIPGKIVGAWGAFLGVRRIESSDSSKCDGNTPDKEQDSLSDSHSGGKHVTVPVFYITCRKKTAHKSIHNYYGFERGDKLQYGVSQVSVPKKYKIGKVERPKWYRLEFSENETNHIVLQRIGPMEEISFIEKLKMKIQSSQNRDAFLFVHGFNESFSKAALRTAQMAKDLSFTGAPIFFSWPSKGGPAYFGDTESIDIAKRHLGKAIKLIASKSQVSKLHLIAHSLGTKVLTEALINLKKEHPTVVGVIDQVILCAPDIDAEVFKQTIAPALSGMAGRRTIYVSRKDKALALSRWLRRSGINRVGEDLSVYSGIDTIDSSSVDTSALGHGYFSKTKQIIDDMHALINFNYPPDHEERKLIRIPKRPRFYWSFTSKDTYS